MTYPIFLLVFLLAPVVVLSLRWRNDIRQGWWQRAVIATTIAALVYTTPWDNYLVATRVWYYDPARVLGVTIGWVPIEEYTFFVLQTLLTGLWLLWLVGRVAPAELPSETGGRAGSGRFAALWPLSPLRRGALAAA